MPFPTQTPTPFTSTAVSMLRAGQNGCYGLFKQGLWIYVGKGDIRERLLAHLDGDNPCITRNAPTHFVTVVTPDMDAVEKALILELAPICNKKVG
jgi:hypothetical protein